MSAETFAEALLDGLTASNVALVAGVPDGVLAPAIALLQGLERPRYVECAREEECIGVAAGAAMAGERGLVLCQNAGLLNSIGAYATLAERYRLPIVLVIANRGGIGDAKPYDIEKHAAFAGVAPALGYVHAVTLAGFMPALVGEAYAWAEAAERPIILAVEKGGA